MLCQIRVKMRKLLLNEHLSSSSLTQPVAKITRQNCQKWRRFERLRSFECLCDDLVLDVGGVDVGREVTDLEAGLKLEANLKKC